MTILIVTYPNTPGSRFDEAYYRESHIGRVRVLWKDLLDGVELLRGGPALRGGDPPYHCVAILRFKSPEALQQAFAMPEAADMPADVPNYTDVLPAMQICERAG